MSKWAYEGVMLCLACKVPMNIYTTRGVKAGNRVRRGRQCPKCSARMSTWESERRAPEPGQLRREISRFIRAARHIEEFLAELKAAEHEEHSCEVCGEPAGGGGALCPVHLEEAGIRR